MNGVTIGTLAVAMVALFFGAGVQSIVGFGMNLIAVPFILVAGGQRLVPGPLIVVLLAQSVLMGLGDRGATDWALLRWFLPVRVLGTIAGSYAATRLRPEGVTIVVGTVVIVSVAITARGWRVPPRPGAWGATGFVSGFSNVMSAIGGPPLAMALVDHKPQAVRATQSWSALLGGAMSIITLAFRHRFQAADVTLGLALIPAGIAGWALSRPLVSRYPTPERIRPIVYAVAVVGSLMAIVRVVAF
jgi:uncharacterized protein